MKLHFKHVNKGERKFHVNLFKQICMEPHTYCLAVRRALSGQPWLKTSLLLQSFSSSVKALPVQNPDPQEEKYSVMGIKRSPHWCGSVDWVPACEPKGHQFNSLSGHMPGLWARYPVGGTWEATTHWCFSSSLPPSLTLCLNITK